MKTLHLVCNAHIDPIWLWDWEEGAAATLSTFRSAAQLAREFDYIFCHNEALLYEWIEEYDPSLFAEIQSLAREGKWKIMGGWYLQPDCNLPNGESFVRQMMVGRRYFEEKFGQRPTTAVNVDPFGHTIGLPQLLRGCGFDSYLICRPNLVYWDHPDDFMWEGIDGSVVRVCRVSDNYSSPMGEAADKIREALEKEKDKDVSIVMWGVGNHGGGPSRKDLRDIEALMKESDVEIKHSTPEAYMAEELELPVVKRSLNPCMPGCYTSMVNIKQRHHLLETRLYSVEKMCVAAHLQAGMVYPMAEFEEAQRALMQAQFHDILPGSAVKAGEETGLRTIDYGLEIVGRLRARAMLALSREQIKAEPGEYPILVYNPHPYPVTVPIDVSFILENQNWDDTFTDIVVYDGETPLPTQVIKEDSNMNLDWAKRIVFTCTLRPMCVNRFDCKTNVTECQSILPKIEKDFEFEGERVKARISAESGLLESFSIDGQELISGPTIPVLYKDDPNPWGMEPEQHIRLAEPDEPFRLMTVEEATKFTASAEPVSPIRWIEDGPVMQEIETLLTCRQSAIRINWRLYRTRPYIDVTLNVLFLEKNALIKWHLPIAFKGVTRGQTAYGQEVLEQTGMEVVAQNWISHNDDTRTFAVMRKGNYGFDCSENEIRLTLVRGVAYACHPIGKRDLLPKDRFVPRMDQGEHTFTFRLTGGHRAEVEEKLERRTQIFVEEPFALQMFPTGRGRIPSKTFVFLSGDCVLLTAMKASRDGGFILRLFNNNHRPETCLCRIPHYDVAVSIDFKPHEVRTFRLTESGLHPCKEMYI